MVAFHQFETPNGHNALPLLDLWASANISINILCMPYGLSEYRSLRRPKHQGPHIHAKAGGSSEPNTTFRMGDPVVKYILKSKATRPFAVRVDYGRCSIY